MLLQNMVCFGSKHLTVFLTDHEPIIFLFTQKLNPNHRVYRFNLILMKFPNLHIVWTAGKNLALPDTLSRNTPPELLTRKTTVEIPQNIKSLNHLRYGHYFSTTNIRLSDKGSELFWTTMLYAFSNQVFRESTTER